MGSAYNVQKIRREIELMHYVGIIMLAKMWWRPKKGKKTQIIGNKSGLEGE